MKSFLKRLFRKFFSYFADRFHNSIKWLNDEVYKWLPKVLKGLGFAGLASSVISTFYTSYNSALDKFGLFARLLQIDDLFESINNAFGSFLINHVNTDFVGVCNSFGIIAAINEILNAVGWSFLIYVFIFVARVIFSSIASITLFIPKL